MKPDTDQTRLRREFGDVTQDDRRWVQFRNDSSETAPAYGVLRPTGVATMGGVRVMTIDKPSSTVPKAHYINGAFDVAPGKTGYCSRAEYVDALYDTGTPTFDDVWGPAAGQWSLHSGNDGFRIVGGPIAGRVRVSPVVGDAIRRGVLDGNLAVGGSATVSVWEWNGSAEADTGVNITAYDWVGMVGLAGDKVWIQWDRPSKRWYILADSERVLLGKTDASHAKGANGTISIWSGTAGSETDTTVNVTAYNRFANVASGKWVMIAHNGSSWYLISAEC